MEKIAVIGMANLFPGSKGLDEFWQNLLHKRDSRTDATRQQMGVDPQAYDGEEGDADKYYCMRGGYIHDFQLDCEGYALPAEYLSELDDVYQWSLYVAREALRDAGYLQDSDSLSDCGVILGNLSFPTKSSNHLFMPLYHKTVEAGLQKLIGNDSFRLANFSDAKDVHPANALIAGYPSALVAQSLGLGGANFALDAACASSCYSVKLACDYLNTGKANLMLAGAVSASDPFFVNMGFSIFHAYPGNKKSAPLDKNSEGLFAGEGAGMMALKRYSDAVADGDHIYAVIKGGGLSNDGKGEFVLSPNTKGQVLVYERAYADAGLDPKDVEFVECHATGTPKGDKVELTSMETFFGRHNNRPLIGSVKSNVAHLLTAAGMPGMMKTITAMNEGVIPPTINMHEPVQTAKGYMSAELIPTETVAWPERGDGGPRHAGVSVFGFGGSNAHLVFEQARGEPALGEVSQNDYGSIAIVGMDAHFGGCEGMGNFSDMVSNGKQQFRELPTERWKGIDRESALLKEFGLESAEAPRGAYVEQFDIDFLRFKVPPNENDRLIPQQLMMMKVADNALKEAKLAEGGNVAVLVAMGVELELHQFRGRVNLATQVEESLRASGIELSAQQQEQLVSIAKDSVHNAAQLNQYTSFIGNIMASRISSLWDFSGPAITLSAEENSVNRCLEVADNLFKTSDIEAVVIAAVDLAGSVENVVLRNQFSRINSGPDSLSLAEGVNGWTVGEGAGAVVLKRLGDAQSAGNKIYAAIESLAFETGTDAQAVADAASEALHLADRSAAEIGYLELNASGIDSEDQAEIQGLGLYEGVCAGSAKSNVGHCYSAAGIAALIRSASIVHQGVLPAVPQWGKAKQGVNFHLNAQPQNWSAQQRVAAISCLGVDGSSSHVILSAVPGYETFSGTIAPTAKARPKLVKTITLGGAAIQDKILSAENLQAFDGLRQNLQGKQLSAPAELIAQFPNIEPVTIPHALISRAPAMEENSMRNTTGKTTRKTMKTRPAFSQAVSGPALSGSAVLEGSPQFLQFQQNLSQVSRAHAAFLDSRQQSMQQMGELIEIQTQVLANTGGDFSMPLTASIAVPSKAEMPPLVERYSKPENIIWDTDALVEFAEGKIGNVFGEEYASIDSYGRRVRLPTTDYLLVSRVTELEAKINEYSPCMMTTEYDIPTDAPYLVDGHIPWAVSVESGQCDLLLISYLGIDFQNKGDRIYRLLDCTLTFMDDMAFGGETLRYEIHIDSYANNGDTLLFFFHYDCFVEDRLVLTMRGGCAGFFTDEELKDGKGVILTEDEKTERANTVKQSFSPIIANSKTAYNYDELYKLINGDVVGCFGRDYDQGGFNPSLKFASEKFLMIERVSKIDSTGGPWGLGLLEAHKQLEPDHWYFPCHFKDDPVMAGSLMAEGCGQLVMFFMLYLGMQADVKNARFQPMPGEAQKVRCRGQVLPQSNVLTYRMEVVEIGMSPRPYMKANVDIILDGKVVVDFKNLGVMMKEQAPNAPYALAIPGGDVPASIAAPVQQIESVKAKKDPFANPNAPLMKVEADLSARKEKGVTPIKHFEAPYVEGQNRVPNKAPFTPWHLFEFATGDLGKCFGPDYDIFKGLIPPRTPCGDLQLTTRVLEVRGDRGDLKSTAYCKAEYEVPEDAWYFEKNSHASVMPYSVLMEISLQPNGFISTYVGSTLGFPGKELFFRNLDGTGKLLRDVDLRGKTIVNDSTLLSTSIAGNNIIQSFTFTLSVDGQPFYDGKAVFGYFTADALANQLGMDKGNTTNGWHIDNKVTPERIELASASAPMFQAPEGKPHYRLAGGQLHFIDTVDVVEGGGKAGKGYIYSERTIDPDDWFFQFHFHQDPVMPGSLGVEAIIESMQVYALKNDLGADLVNPKFSQILSTVVWKYRGQIVPTNRQMALDVHITDVIKEPGKVTIIGDANLSKDGLRIYEVIDIAICLEEAE